MSATKDSRTPTLIILLACATLTVMAGATIAPSLPGLQDHFADNPDATWLVPLILTVPGLAIALASPVTGYIVDRATKRNVLVFGICLYILAGSSGLYLDAIGHILIGRVLLGIAVACIMPSAMALIANLYTDEERGRVLGYQAAAMSFGGVIFIMSGGLLADVSWRGPFAVYLAPLVLLPLIALLVPPGKPLTANPDEPMPATSFPWAFAATIIFSMFANFLIFYTLPLKLPFLLRELGIESAALAGAAIATLTFTSGIVSLGFGRIRGLARPPVIAACSFFITACGFAALATLPPVWVVFALMMLIGFASGVVLPNASTWLYSQVPPTMRGRAAGYMTMSVFTAQFLSAPIVAFLEPIGGLSLIYAAAALTAIGAGLFYCSIAVRQPKARPA
ncbi:MAG: MFS transporter [Ahrensia sp.]